MAMSTRLQGTASMSLRNSVAARPASFARPGVRALRVQASNFYNFQLKVTPGGE